MRYCILRFGGLFASSLSILILWSIIEVGSIQVKSKRGSGSRKFLSSQKTSSRWPKQTLGSKVVSFRTTTQENRDDVKSALQGYLWHHQRYIKCIGCFFLFSLWGTCNENKQMMHGMCPRRWFGQCTTWWCLLQLSLGTMPMLSWGWCWTRSLTEIAVVRHGLRSFFFKTTIKLCKLQPLNSAMCACLVTRFLALAWCCYFRSIVEMNGNIGHTLGFSILQLLTGSHHPSLM